MADFLIVPIHLDALWLKTDRSVAEARVDFTRLPYFDGQRDVNPNIAYLSEDIAAKPFQPLNFRLKAGIHLHWSLPDALTQGTQTTEGSTFPAVPNRWLVTRSRQNGANPSTVEKQWVVESDYLYPDSKGYHSGSISFPVDPRPDQGMVHPFRFLGRRMSLDLWLDPQKDAGTPAEYLSHLSAVGYGEPTFAALYPNCHSVFGFYDSDLPQGDGVGLQYDVVGWYSQPEQDYFGRLMARLQPGDDVEAGLKQEAGWTVTGLETASPGQMLCYARLQFNPAAGELDQTVSIAVGHTGTEALSAHLAQKLAPERKHELEDQLEAVLLLSRLERQQLDLDPKFLEARHEKGFRAVSAGTLWTVKPESARDAPADAEKALTEAQLTLPPTMADALNELNLVQRELDQAIQDIDTIRHEIFTDWYKYMLCAYPPEDSLDHYPDLAEVRNYIELKDLPALEEAQRAVRNIERRREAMSAALKKQLTDYNEHHPGQSIYILKQTPGPRYWQPTEPVVLIAGELAQPTVRHGQDGRSRADSLLECGLLSGVTTPGSGGMAEVTALWAKFDALWRGQMTIVPEPIGFQRRQQQPWHPILLEWEVAFHTAAEQSNLASSARRYGSTFITSNYDLKPDTVDFSPKPDKVAVVSGANVYTGTSILTPSAQIGLKNRIEAYLVQYVSRQETLAKDFFEARAVPPAEQDNTYLEDHVVDLAAWYQQTFCQPSADDPVCDLIRAYQVLNDPNEPILSQALSGFSDGLLMHKLSMQFPVADPLGFEEDQAFAARVSQAVHRSNRTAPIPQNDFNPIRAGAMEIRQLRLIDSFGQLKDLRWDQIITSEPTTNPVNPAWPLLSPRLVQSARVNFRWLSARQGVEEMNDHPATTPICGWLLPNHLDNSLMIYDNEGQALGLIDYLANWEPAPGSRRPIPAAAIHDPANQTLNPHLKRVVSYLSLAPNETDPAQQERKRSFLSAFMETLDNALDHIDPENYAQHQSQALLMGRPMALVRASLNLELADPPAVDHTWPAFIQDLSRNTRDNHGFTEVQFPLRVGDASQVNDGLVGYWIEAGNGFAGDLFYAPQSDEVEDERIRTHADETVHIYQSLTQDPYHLTMLIDPRGKVHVTTGILPTKDIDIPPDQFVPALQAIEITFLTTPIVTSLGQINLALPPEPGYTWSWLTKHKTQIDDPGRWVEISTQATIDKAVFLAHYPSAEVVWTYLHQPEVRWLHVSEADPGQSTIVAENNRRLKRLTGDFAGLESKLNTILGVTPDNTPTTPMTKAGFAQRYPQAEAVWTELLTPAVGWLRPIADVADKAKVVPKDQRPKANPGNNGPPASAPAQLPDDYAGLEPKVDSVFDLYAAGITPLHTQARFVGPQEIREGWLKLRHTDDVTNNPV